VTPFCKLPISIFFINIILKKFKKITKEENRLVKQQYLRFKSSPSEDTDKAFLKTLPFIRMNKDLSNIISTPNIALAYQLRQNKKYIRG
jgi:pyruvate/oxaloacetate carboxyltransferase